MTLPSAGKDWHCRAGSSGLFWEAESIPTILGSDTHLLTPQSLHSPHRPTASSTSSASLPG